MTNSIIEKIDKKSGGIIGVLAGLMSLYATLSLEDLALFCDNTPDGVDLWRAFKDRRDAPDASPNYGFIEYGKEVLQELN